jgi:hypothetical protein
MTCMRLSPRREDQQGLPIDEHWSVKRGIGLGRLTNHLIRGRVPDAFKTPVTRFGTFIRVTTFGKRFHDRESLQVMPAHFLPMPK